ncbi:MAG: L-threonylcarbamoyladenylate synthase [Gemmatales bacterium]|nr:L-threonylcarbamoyladenylate synthase [Gemmatales bacterium]
MAQVYRWNTPQAQRPIIETAVRTLEQGGLVIFPTETVYGVAAHALDHQAVERLIHCKGRPEDKPLALALARPSASRDWVPEMSLLARRLMRRCWPGPVTIVFRDGWQTGLITRLPETVRRYIAPGPTLGIRIPDHEAIRQVLSRLPGPLVLTSANRSGEPATVTGSDAHEALGQTVDLVIDDGPCRFREASTVVEVDGQQLRILRPGAVSAEMLQRLTCCIVLFVCSGNTCRSPLAAAFCRKSLADKLGCSADQLAQHGFLILSAGTSALPGHRATPEAVAAASRLGADLSDHLSQPLTQSLLAQADFIYTMTHHHLDTVCQRLGDSDAKVAILDPNGHDIHDPLGGDASDYDNCAQQIAQAVAARIESDLWPCHLHHAPSKT